MDGSGPTSTIHVHLGYCINPGRGQQPCRASEGKEGSSSMDVFEMAGFCSLYQGYYVKNKQK